MRRRGAKRAVIECGRVCQLVRHFPYHPPTKGHKHGKLIRKWHIVALAFGAFGASIYLLGHQFTAGVVVARVVEAVGDVLLDRGVAQPEV
jgi:hypothetical protein